MPNLLCELNSMLLLGAASFASSSVSSGIPTYQVFRANGKLEVDGLLKEEAWKKAALISNFKLPWDQEKPQATEARFLWDSDFLYGAFRAWDHEIVTWTAPNHRGKIAVTDHDRVEIFFAWEESLKDYYCLEIDPDGVVFDYKAHYHRNFDPSWHLTGLKVASKILPDGYVVELAVPLAVMKELGFPVSASGFTWKVGVYRADFSLTQPGKLKMLWQTWIDPGFSQPDFHVPSSFGYFEFVKKK